MADLAGRPFLVRILVPIVVVFVAAAAWAGDESAPSNDGMVVGIQGRFLTAEQIADVFNVAVAGGGVLVEHVADGSPAERAGLHGGTLQATIQGESVVLGGDLILQLEVHKVCAGACLLDAPAQLTSLGWIGVTYLRKGKVQRTVIDVSESDIEPVGPDLAIPDTGANWD